jgi:hypothetical protein
LNNLGSNLLKKMTNEITKFHHEFVDTSPCNIKTLSASC